MNAFKVEIIIKMPKNLVLQFNRFPQVAGGRNVPAAVQQVAKASIDQSRQMKYQSLNEYRKRFRLKPYSSFEELTGERNFFEESKVKWKQQRS